VRTSLKLLLVAAGAVAIVLSWGYWHSMSHASLNVRVDDYAMKTERIAYGTPHNVALVLRDAAQEHLATARSVEPLGYILAIHPQSGIGTCEHHARAAPSPSTQGDYAACYREYSAWSSTWAPKVRTADVSIGECQLLAAPVAASSSNQDWWLWWVPLPHVGGIPRRHFELVISIDSRACAAVAR
jgi:hypothetical protein